MFKQRCSGENDARSVDAHPMVLFLVTGSSEATEHLCRNPIGIIEIETEQGTRGENDLFEVCVGEKGFDKRCCALGTTESTESIQQVGRRKYSVGAVACAREIVGN